MKKKIFFIDEHNSSLNNGIGTFRETFLDAMLSYPNIELILISLNYDCTTLECYQKPYGLQITFPSIANGNWRDSGSIIWPLLNMYIEDDNNNIFIFNHSPCSDFIKLCSSFFRLSKKIFIIHDQGWCAPLFGNKQQFSKIINSKTKDDNYTDIMDYVEKEQDIYLNVDKVICLSSATESILKELYKVPANKVVCIHNGIAPARNIKIDRKRTRITKGIRPDDKVLLFIARSVPHKGICALLQALSKIKKQFQFFKCVLIGDVQGFTRYWDLAHNISENLILTGKLNQAEVNEWYSIADVGIISSYTEQCSYVALEMMKYKIPIISSDGNGLMEMFTDNHTAWVAKIEGTRYIDNLANQIMLVLTSKKDVLGMVCEHAYKMLCSQYSTKLMSKKYYSLFKEL